MHASHEQPPVYVVYPAALLDGWEVVKEDEDDAVSFDTREEATAYAKARALMDGGALVKVEDWYGHTERVLDARP